MPVKYTFRKEPDRRNFIKEGSTLLHALMMRSHSQQWEDLIHPRKGHPYYNDMVEHMIHLDAYEEYPDAIFVDDQGKETPARIMVRNHKLRDNTTITPKDIDHILNCMGSCHNYNEELYSKLMRLWCDSSHDDVIVLEIYKEKGK